MQVLELLRGLFQRKPEYVYGTAGAHQTPARRHKSGRVEFKLWKAGEHGHKRDFWVPFNGSWWSTFKEQPDGISKST